MHNVTDASALQYEPRDHSYAYHFYPEYFAENSTFLGAMVTKLQPFNT